VSRGKDEGPKRVGIKEREEGAQGNGVGEGVGITRERTMGVYDRTWGRGERSITGHCGPIGRKKQRLSGVRTPLRVPFPAVSAAGGVPQAAGSPP